MITEDYVSFDIAKLLKEKGFDGECMSMYVTPKPHVGMGNPNEAKIAPHGRDNHYYDGYLYQCEAPTLQMAMKWLRKVHHIIITIDYANICGLGFTYTTSVIKINNNGEIEEGDGLNVCLHKTSYEEACETAIKYCLENLI